MTRKTKQDWLEAGLAALDQHGAAGLTIEALTTALGVTKGSFYHHFANYDDFKAQLLAFWTEAVSAIPVAATMANDDPVALLDFVLDYVLSRDPETESSETAIRAWALQDALVRGYVETVDARRVEYLEALFAAISGDLAAASLQARMLYTMLVGTYTVLPPLDFALVRDLYDEFKRLYGIT